MVLRPLGIYMTCFMCANGVHNALLQLSFGLPYLTGYGAEFRLAKVD